MIVYKFGGTILKDQQRVIAQIKEGVKKYKKVVVVVSAIGRFGDPYATDTLLSNALNVSKKERDRIVSCGEIISSVILSDKLIENSMKAISVSPEEINLCFDEKFSISSRIDDYLHNYDVLVVPGFIGIKNGEIVTLERGGSNITAAFLANYFKCNLVIFSDIDGLYTEDPKTHSKAKRLSIINTKELLDLALIKPSFFPKLAIKYIEQGNFFVLFTTLDSQNGTIIGNIFL